MFFSQLGFQLPELRWVPTPSIPEGMLSVKLEEWTVFPSTRPREQRIVDAEPEGLPVPTLGTAVHPVTGAARAIVDRSAMLRLVDAGLHDTGTYRLVVVNVFAEAAAHADELLGLEDVEYQLARLGTSWFGSTMGTTCLEGAYPALVDTVLARHSLGDLTRVLRAIIWRALIHNLPSILERLLEYDTVSSDPAAVVLDDRLALRPGHAGRLAGDIRFAAPRPPLLHQHRFTWAENTWSHTCSSRSSRPGWRRAFSGRTASRPTRSRMMRPKRSATPSGRS